MYVYDYVMVEPYVHVIRRVVVQQQTPTTACFSNVVYNILKMVAQLLIDTLAIVAAVPEQQLFSFIHRVPRIKQRLYWDMGHCFVSFRRILHNTESNALSY